MFAQQQMEVIVPIFKERLLIFQERLLQMGAWRACLRMGKPFTAPNLGELKTALLTNISGE